MSYWGSGPIENDYAFDAVGAYVLMLRERMFKEAQAVLEKSHPEQAIVASLQCLRLIAEQHPKCVRVSFRRKHYEEAKTDFERWYKAVKDKIPSKYRGAVLEEAIKEFELWEKNIIL